MNGTQPQLFARLQELLCLHENEICAACDGFYAVISSLAEILSRRGITSVQNSRGEELACSAFFDDWYLYADSEGAEETYGLFKMREQEFDAQQGRNADGDTPGVTVSFIELRTNVLLDCLHDPSAQNRVQLNAEINRVVASGGQRHSERLKQYFLRTESQGAYMIAKLYTEHIASLAKDGSLPVPERYRQDYIKRGAHGRVARFLEENNVAAGRLICDHEKIYIADPQCPTDAERLAILATHAGNTSVFSFAAEVQYHARFLNSWARIPIPFIGRSPYASAIRADMSIGDSEFAGPRPYYHSGSRIVRKQYHSHKDEALK